MKLITRDTDYAVRALAFLAKNKERIVSVAELVKELKIPRPFLRKILQILNQEGIVVSHKGLGGGFSLARPAQEIRLLDLVKVFQGGLKINECLFKKKICPQVRVCPLKKKIDEIEDFAARKLNTINIGVLAK